MTLLTGVFVLFSVLVTAVISGILGMAGGMVLMGILVWTLQVREAMMLHATAQFFSNASRAYIHRTNIDFKSLKYYLTGMVLSFVVISLFTFLPSKALVFGMLGIGPFIPQIFRGRVKFDFTKPKHAFFCGLAITCMQLMAGVSGAALSMFFQDIDMTRHEVVATKAFTQSISHVTKLFYFGLIVPHAHSVTGLPLWIYFAVIPAAMLGANIGKFILNKLTDGQFYKATQIVLWVLGAVYLGKAALLLVQRHA